MKKEVITLEFSNAEVMEPDYMLAAYPMGVLTKMMLKANELGLKGKEIEVVEVKENFATMNKYIDFVIKGTLSSNQ